MTEEHTGISGNSEEVVISSLAPQENYDPTNLDKNTCFLCCMRFSNVETVRKHQHHVHMRWVTKGSVDYSKVEFAGKKINFFYYFIIPPISLCSIANFLSDYCNYFIKKCE